VSELQGALTIGRGDLDEKAPRRGPDYAERSEDLQVAPARQGDLVELVARRPQWPRLRPDLFDVHLGQGLAPERQGQLDEASTGGQRALRLEPEEAETQNNLGIDLAMLGRFDEAAVRFQRAIDLKPYYPDAHNNLGNILEKRDGFDEAVACYQRAIDLKPYYPEAHYNLGNVLARQDKTGEAVACYHQALRLKPDYADAHNNLGTVLAKLDRLDEAMASYQQALRLEPNVPGTHNNLGLLLAKLDKPAEAVACYEQALRLKPDDTEVQNSLGIMLAKLGRLDESAACFQRVICLKPDHPDAHNNLGSVREKQDKLDEAVASYQQAIRVKPDYPDAHNNLGVALWKLGRLDEAVASYQQALHFQPDYPEAQWNRSLVWLAMGHFEQGWPGYDWRWKCKEFGSMPSFKAPLWDGSPLDGRTILIHAEQGLGDTLQFVRYVPLVHERGGRVIMMCQPPLMRLLAHCPGIERLMAHGETPPEIDLHVPLLSLPKLLGTTVESVPADGTYLEADPDLVEIWRQRLGAYPGFKIGIAWQGNPKFRLDRIRSIPLAQFAPLADVPGVHLLSLQKGAGREQLAAPERRFSVTDLGGQMDETTGAFMDTGAVMKNLDLVITSDTSVAHLAGALRVPVWLALNAVPDWRWLLNRDDSPWYPTMRLFRQTRMGHWEDVFHHMAEVLRERLASTATPRPVAVEVPPGELIDKITILEIKSERITDAVKRHHVGAELALLSGVRDWAMPGSAELTRLAGELKAVNEALWGIEDEIRLCEREEDFGPRFISLARSVYRINDRRAALKRQVSELVGSELFEEKSYIDY
jgi:tetratricopeptide (TPR) repeat protein